VGHFSTRIKPFTGSLLHAHQQSFTFNLGSAALQRSTLRQKLNYELYKEASKEFMKWVYAGGKKLPGLVKRRKTEQELFRSSLENNWY